MINKMVSGICLMVLGLGIVGYSVLFSQTVVVREDRGDKT